MHNTIRKPPKTKLLAALRERYARATRQEKTRVAAAGIRAGF